MQDRILKNKKAFTMIELLICLVCLGCVCVGIGSIATAVKQYSAYINDREAVMLGEYQDVMNLKVNGLDFRDKTNYPENIHEIERYTKGTVFSINDRVVGNNYQQAIYTSEDPLIVSVDQNGNCRALYEGVTYIKVELMTLESDGKYHNHGDIIYIPVMVLSEKFNMEMQMMNYYLYGGKHYVCWLHDQ